MQELYSDFGNRTENNDPTPLSEFDRAFSAYMLEKAPGERKRKTDGCFDPAVKYCNKNHIRPVFFVHAVFNTCLGETIKPYDFRDPRIIRKYESWADRIPPELIGVELESPHSVDVHRELETMASMILTKHGDMPFDSLKFKIACADPVLDVTPAARIILSEAHEVVLKYYGQEYLDWCSTNPWKSLVLQDFGFSHPEISRTITDGRTATTARESATNN